jgi:hypothetical protein
VNRHDVKGFEPIASYRLEECSHLCLAKGPYLFTSHLWRVHGQARVTRYEAIVHSCCEGTLQHRVHIYRTVRGDNPASNIFR